MFYVFYHAFVKLLFGTRICAGRSHTLCARSSTQRNQWVHAIEKCAKKAVRTERYAKIHLTSTQKFVNLVQDQAKAINESSV
jgi:hypothetical protein